jgi:TATA-box binding protein (TBP) (component of TFIID and TFIIIB)
MEQLEIKDQITFGSDSETNLEIFTMTLSVHLFSNNEKVSCLNMSNLYNHLTLDEDITGLKYKWKEQNFIKGKYSTSSIKKSRNKNQEKLNKVSFYNQLSLIVKVITGREVNVKLFQNGKLQLTGCKQKLEAISAANIIISKLNKFLNKSVNLKLKRHNPILLDSDNNVYSTNKGHPIIGWYNEKTNEYHISNKNCIYDETLGIFITTKQFGCRSKLLFDNTGNQVGVQTIDLLKGKKKLYTKNMNIQIINNHVYCNDNTIIGNVNYTFDEKYNPNNGVVVDKEKEIIHMDLCPYLDVDKNVIHSELSSLDSNCHVDVYSIMAKKNIGFEINQTKFATFLRNNHFIVKYNPETYSGLYILFKYNTLPNATINGLCTCNTKCTCDNISLIFFQSGNIICSGFKSEEQLNKVWDYMDPFIQNTHQFYKKIDFNLI